VVRRMASRNPRGSYEQAQVQTEGCGPIEHPKDRQARVSQAVGTCTV
jgi:hypothetical protein